MNHVNPKDNPCKGCLLFGKGFTAYAANLITPEECLKAAFIRDLRRSPHTTSYQRFQPP
jgi:hypothetical protein